ncbi:MAG: class I SAM-dependent methyltransferase [Polaromonas sp.]|uniref:class I SAM-dependent methyltransferase n=1 Tax=Polaromonas sp. TaxID=1869339 RepID=UPI0027340153|nr:class I SAM-dependent methyltransferase [Polaromonas sp.]MDP3795871.1 class I SAM-dependent methyltransferase [Polaromonas sp.]
MSVSPVAPFTSATAYPLIHWTEGKENQAHSARWRSERGAAPPKRVVVADDSMSADAAYRLACEGTGLLWRGDFQNARLLLQALARRVDKPAKPKRDKRHKAGGAEVEAAAPAPVFPEAFHLHRQAQAQRARVLGMVLIPFDADYSIPLRRAPDAKKACAEAWGTAAPTLVASRASGGALPLSPEEGAVPPKGGLSAELASASNIASVASLRELMGFISSHEWRRKGVAIPALGEDGPHNRIHPHYGVFSPVRGEYIDLVAQAPVPEGTADLTGFDIGTGTGVLAAVLALRSGVQRVVATDQDPRALACARDNLKRLGFPQVEVREANLFPEGKAHIIVCNPPWLPARPGSPIEHAVYDEDSRMLLGFLNGLAAHLEPKGEGWLILSDIAEHLGLRTRAWLLAAIDAAGFKVVDRLDTQAHHPKASDATDPLHAARAAEVTSLWRLAAK